jgi:hypothetical protein
MKFLLGSGPLFVGNPITFRFEEKREGFENGNFLARDCFQHKVPFPTIDVSPLGINVLLIITLKQEYSFNLQFTQSNHNKKCTNSTKQQNQHSRPATPKRRPTKDNTTHNTKKKIHTQISILTNHNNIIQHPPQPQPKKTNIPQCTDVTQNHPTHNQTTNKTPPKPKNQPKKPTQKLYILNSPQPHKTTKTQHRT